MLTTDRMAHLARLEHSTPYRADEPVQKNMHSDVLANAPETDGQFFVVPRIV